LGCAAFCLALLTAAAASGVLERRSTSPWLLAGLLGLLILPNLAHVAPAGHALPDPGLSTPELIAQRGIGVTTRDEYEPRWSLQRPPYRGDAVQVVSGRASVQIRPFTPALWSGRSFAPEPSVIELPVHYFPGWRAWVGGRRVPLSIAESTGLIRVPLPAGDQLVEVVFGRTPVRAAGDGLSLASALILIVLLAAEIRRSRWDGTRAGLGTAPAGSEGAGSGSKTEV
jgi:hypothetical protein